MPDPDQLRAATLDTVLTAEEFTAWAAPHVESEAVATEENNETRTLADYLADLVTRFERTLTGETGPGWAPAPGRLAWHKDGLDERVVTRVSDDGTLVWLRLMADVEGGPYTAANYVFTDNPAAAA